MTRGSAPGAGLCLRSGAAGGARPRPPCRQRCVGSGGGLQLRGRGRAAGLSSPPRGCRLPLPPAPTPVGTQPAAGIAESPKYLLTTVITNVNLRGQAVPPPAWHCGRTAQQGHARVPKGDRQQWEHGGAGQVLVGRRRRGAQRGDVGGYKGGTHCPGCRAVAQGTLY